MSHTEHLLTDLRSQTFMIESLQREIGEIADRRADTIQQLRTAGMSYARIGEVAGLSYQRVQQIANR